MAKKKDYSKEYRRARKNFMRRIREWKTKYHWLVEAPAIPKNPTLKDVERLEKIKLKTTTERQVKKYERAYDIAWDEGNPDVFKEPRNLLIDVPIEEEINIVREYEFETEPEDSEAGVMADLQYLLNGLIEHGRTQAPVWNSAEIVSSKEMAIRNIYNDAINKVGNLKAYLAYLEDSDTHTDLTDACDSVFRASTDKQLDDSLNSFAVALNLGRPITNEQSYTLTTDNAIDFDYSDTDME